ncbi:MAG: hypothetical protein MPK75_04925 [Alphaproteobacteria bacterium]|nr:hypothetical protein [Alphaproteobacteria bacterium]
MAKAKKSHRTMPLRFQTIDYMPRHIRGVYAFWYPDTGKCIYVGKAEKQSIRTRLMQEWQNSHNANLKLWMRVYGDSLEICYLPVKDEKIDRMESKLIRMWNPTTNIRKKRR